MAEKYLTRTEWKKKNKKEYTAKRIDKTIREFEKANKKRDAALKKKMRKILK